MDTMILKKVRTVVSVHVLALSSMAAWAQDYPWKAITLVVGYPAGGSVDLVARAIAPGLSRRLGQPVNVENIPGTSGALAAARVALAEPDGHTLLLGSPAEVGINHLVSRRRDGYNPLKDSTPIGLIGSQPLVLVAGRKTPVASIGEFLRATAEAPAAMAMPRRAWARRCTWRARPFASNQGCAWCTCLRVGLAPCWRTWTAATWTLR